MKRESRYWWEALAKGYQMVIDGYHLIAKTKGHWEAGESWRCEDAEWQLRGVMRILREMEKEKE